MCRLQHSTQETRRLYAAFHLHDKTLSFLLMIICQCVSTDGDAALCRLPDDRIGRGDNYFIDNKPMDATSTPIRHNYDDIEPMKQCRRHLQIAINRQSHLVDT